MTISGEICFLQSDREVTASSIRSSQEHANQSNPLCKCLLIWRRSSFKLFPAVVSFLLRLNHFGCNSQVLLHKDLHLITIPQTSIKHHSFLQIYLPFWILSNQMKLCHLSSDSLMHSGKVIVPVALRLSRISKA